MGEKKESSKYPNLKESKPIKRREIIMITIKMTTKILFLRESRKRRKSKQFIRKATMTMRMAVKMRMAESEESLVTKVRSRKKIRQTIKKTMKTSSLWANSKKIRLNKLNKNKCRLRKRMCYPNLLMMMKMKLDIVKIKSLRKTRFTTKPN